MGLGSWATRTATTRSGTALRSSTGSDWTSTGTAPDVFVLFSTEALGDDELLGRVATLTGRIPQPDYPAATLPASHGAIVIAGQARTALVRVAEPFRVFCLDHGPAALHLFLSSVLKRVPELVLRTGQAALEQTPER